MSLAEKLHELLHDREQVMPSAHTGLMLAAPCAGEVDVLARIIDALDAAAVNGDDTRVMTLLQRAVPEFESALVPGEPLPRERRLAIVRT